MGSQTTLGDLIHPFRADLHFHPLALGAEDGDVQALVAVGFGNRQPVAHTLGVGLIHIRDDAEHLPAVLLLAVERRVENDANSKEIIHALEGTVLLLHLLPNTVNGLRAPLHVVLQSRSLKFLIYGTNEPFDISIAAFLCGVELLFNMVVCIVLQVLERQVFEFALQFVESELVSQRSIEVRRFCGHPPPGFVVLRLLNITHDAHARSDDNKYDAHILCEGEQQLAEVLVLHNRILFIKLADARQSMYDCGHIIAEL